MAPGSSVIVPVRDSKRPGGPVVVVARSAWDAFVESVRR
ncbi:DUF397 domain-containing protein [Streptomyces asoensis]